MTALKRVFTLLLVAAVAYGCTKGSDEPIYTGKNANLNIINAVTDVRAINFYLNGTRQNVNSAIFLNGTSGYVSVPVTEQQYQIKEDTLRQQIANIALKLPKDSLRYSLLITGQKAAGNIAGILLDDNYTDTLNRTARIRFVQASPGSASYDVYVGNNISFKNQAFKAVTNFANSTAGLTTIRITPAGGSTAILNAPVTLDAGSYYTLYVKGISNGTGNNALSATLLLTK